MLATERRNAECMCTVLCVKFIDLHVLCSLEDTYLKLLENGKWVKLRIKIPEVLWGMFLAISVKVKDSTYFCLYVSLPLRLKTVRTFVFM